MKKITLFLVALLTATFTFAYDVEIDGIYYNLNHNTKTAEVTHDGNYSDNTGAGYGRDSYTIPEKITYEGNVYIITSIGNYAISKSSFLHSITIPNTVISIGEQAFINCNNLTFITIPDSISFIGNRAFEGTRWFNNQPDGCVYVNNILYTYKGTMPAATHIEVKEGTTKISPSAFFNKNYLISVSIPNSVTVIGDNAFAYCTGLSSISIENPNIELEAAVFHNTAWLNSQPDGCVYINNYLYTYKGEMAENTHIDIKEGTTQICAGAFHQCYSLKSITIPNSVTHIGDRAFLWCWDLNSITIPNSVTYIGDESFYYCKSLTSITIPNNVTYIGNFAFLACESLTSVIIGNNVTSIGEGAFSGCSALTSISIPNSINSIGSNAFYGCSALSASITMPNVHTIGDGAFYNCKSLSDITIGNNLKFIDENTFTNCSNLRTIKLGNSIESIGKDAFKGCTALYSFEISTEIPPIINATTFAEVSSTLQIKVPCNSVEDYKASSHWNSFSNFKGIPHTINVNVNDDKMGQAFVIKQSTCQDITAQILAQALIGHKFVKWSDGYTDNPRTIIVTQDSTFTAEFVANKHNVTLSTENGIVDGAGIYNYGDTITISATPNDGYTFQKWSDGNTDNPRTIIVTEDVNLIAILKANSPSTNLDSNFNTEIRIYTINNTLHIEGVTSDYHILDAAGRLIYSGNASTLTLPRGIYLITMGGEVEKIVL